MAPIREKLVKSLSTFMSNWRELEDAVYDSVSKGDDDADSNASDQKAFEQLVSQMQQTLNTVLEREPYSSEEIAGAMSCLIDALEQIDPELFSGEEEDDLDDDDDDDDDSVDEDEAEETDEVER